MEYKLVSNKKGNVNSRIMALIGALVTIVVATSLAPTMFLNLTSITNAPAWVGTVLPVIVASGLIFIIWRAFSR